MRACRRADGRPGSAELVAVSDPAVSRRVRAEARRLSAKVADVATSMGLIGDRDFTDW